MDAIKQKYYDEAKKKGITALTFGQLLAKLGKSREEAIEAFYQIYRKQGMKDNFAKAEAVATVNEQFDSYSKKWM